jgi:hypothetical protein
LNTGVTVDSAVAAARSALVAKFGAAHRSWINPTVYWRCVNGIVFELLRTGGILTPAQEIELIRIDAILAAREELLRRLAQQPPDAIALTADLRDEWQAEIEKNLQQRGAVLGDTVRLRGGHLSAAGEVECVLTVQIRSGAHIGDVRATINFDPALFALVGSDPGAAVLPASVFVQSTAGQPATVFVQNASAGNQWPAGEHALARLTFRAQNLDATPLMRIPVSNVSVVKNGAPDAAFRGLDAVVFTT